LTIHHELITFHIHDGYRSIGEHRMNNVRSVPLALQFSLSEGFKPRIVVEDLISFFEFFFFNLLSYHLFNPPFVNARIFICLQPHLL
jgi:hypothetical protein